MPLTSANLILVCVLTTSHAYRHHTSSLPRLLPLSSSTLSVTTDLNELVTRIEKLEKSIQSPTGTIRTKPLGPMDNINSLFDSLTFNQLALNARTVEVCAIFSMFIIGCVIGWSLFDRLWLLGGITTCWWASGAVHRDSRGGSFCRRVGVTLAQLIRDIQEKYSLAVVYYRTGRLAFESKKWWDQYDKQYGVTTRLDQLKSAAIDRFSNFNTAFQEYGIQVRQPQCTVF